MTHFRKSLTALAAAVVLTIAAVAAPQPAEARGGRVAAGIIGGLAVGAIIGSMAYNGRGYYGPSYSYGPGYAYGPGYYRPAPVYYGPRCWWQRERVFDGYGWRLRKVRVCS